MSISSQIQRITSAKADIASAIEEKGVSVPTDASIDSYGDLVRSIQSNDWDIYVGEDEPPSTITATNILWFEII